MKKQFLNLGNSTFEQIKSKADQIIEVTTAEDFEKIFPNKILRVGATIKMKIYGYYSCTILEGKKSIKTLYVLNGGRTHKFVGTTLVAIN